MMTGKLVWLECTISRGGFSEERVFRVSPATGDIYVGAAPRHYCYSRNGQPVAADQPPQGKSVPGKIVARVVRHDENELFVSLPDGAVMPVPAGKASEFKGALPDVSVQS